MENDSSIEPNAEWGVSISTVASGTDSVDETDGDLTDPRPNYEKHRGKSVRS